MVHPLTVGKHIGVEHFHCRFRERKHVGAALHRATGRYVGADPGINQQLRRRLGDFSSFALSRNS